MFILFFFFQAEDGIRDLTVTGVQTCALPIWDDIFQQYHNKLQELDVRRMEMPKPMMAILDALNSLPPGTALLVYHKRIPRSEERRVGKECRSRWSTYE